MYISRHTSGRDGRKEEIETHRLSRDYYYTGTFRDFFFLPFFLFDIKGIHVPLRKHSKAQRKKQSPIIYHIESSAVTFDEARFHV